MAGHTLKVKQGSFSICQLPPAAAPPAELFTLPWYSITKTADELSFVVPDTFQGKADRRECGWKCLEVHGPLSFDLVGVFAEISTVLADAGVAIVALSTFDTDYILVKDTALETAVRALRDGEYAVINDPVQG